MKRDTREDLNELLVLFASEAILLVMNEETKIRELDWILHDNPKTDM